MKQRVIVPLKVPRYQHFGAVGKYRVQYRIAGKAFAAIEGFKWRVSLVRCRFQHHLFVFATILFHRFVVAGAQVAAIFDKAP